MVDIKFCKLAVEISAKWSRYEYFVKELHSVNLYSLSIWIHTVLWFDLLRGIIKNEITAALSLPLFARK